MKIDMHCHVREGSIDSKVSLEKYILKLKEKGIDGMLVTDHDTYNGYRYWKNTFKGKKYNDFVVLKGIEYDTLEAGHILILKALRCGFWKCADFRFPYSLILCIITVESAVRHILVEKSI